MSYLPKTFLRLYGADNAMKACAVITKSGEIFQIKPTRQLFKTLDEWHTEDYSLKIQKSYTQPVISGDFLLFKKYQENSDITISTSEKENYLEVKKKLDKWDANPLSFNPYYFHFWRLIKARNFKTVGEADVYLDKKCEEDNISGIIYAYRNFRDFVNESIFTSDTPMTTFAEKVMIHAKCLMTKSHWYIAKLKHVKKCESLSKLSDNKEVTPNFWYTRLYTWRNRTMIPFAISYGKNSFFMLADDSKHYTSLAEANIRMEDLYYKNKEQLIVPVVP
jgi:hypothetical protein